MLICRRTGSLLLAGSAATLLLSGCGSNGNQAGSASVATGATSVRVTLSDDGCTAEPTSVAAGPATFTIKNSGGATVSEAELVAGSKILGEKEGLTPGLSGSFSLNLKPGDYQLYCPNAKTERSDFKVTGASAQASSSGSSAAAALLGKATTGYRVYAQNQAALLLNRTAQFVAAVKAGQVAEAKSLYAQARAPYEAIEPVAESFGDLDPDIDAREGDVPSAEWGGYHRIEQQLWTKNSTAGLVPIANKLLADVRTLAARVRTTEYQPAELANGATDLLTEVGKTKLAGEEERYSRTDLSDIAANVAGSRAAFDLLVPALRTVDSTLAATVSGRFNTIEKLLATLSADGRYRLYPQLSQPQIRQLTVAVDALAEPLSQVGERIVTVK